MKVLLLSTLENSVQTQGMLTGLRQRIGTCEFFALTEAQKNTPERFFASFVRLEQFDRIVLQTSQEWVYRNSLFLRQLPNLSILEEDPLFSARERRFLRRNLQAMPWIRIISHDYQTVRRLVERGYDAYWLRPMFDSEHMRTQRPSSGEAKCVVFDKTHHLNARWQKNFSQMEVQFCQQESELDTLLAAGDVFIYRPQTMRDLPLPMIHAMAYGAVVLTANPGADAAARYHWEDQGNCLFVEDGDAMLEAAQALLSEAEKRRRIGVAAKAMIELFTPVQVGDMLGSILESPVRHAADYPKKTRIFGFEL